MSVKTTIRGLNEAAWAMGETMKIDRPNTVYIENTEAIILINLFFIFDIFYKRLLNVVDDPKRALVIKLQG